MSYDMRINNITTSEIEILNNVIVIEPPHSEVFAKTIPIAQVIWTDYWDQLGTSFMGTVDILTWFCNMEETTYNNLILNTDDSSIMRYGLTEPVIGKLVE